MTRSFKMKDYKIIQTEEDLLELQEKMMSIEEFAFDTETNTLKVLGENKDFICVCVTISWGEYDNYYIPLNHVYEGEYENIPEKLFVRYIKKPFARTDVRIIGHGLKFDLHVMKRIGVNTYTRDLWDTMIASWLCNENTPNGLKENTEMIWGEKPINFKEVTSRVTKEMMKENGLKANNKIPFSLVPIEDAIEYAMPDAFNTYRNYLYFLELLEKEGMLKIFDNSYKKYVWTSFCKEEKGVTVDFERLAKMKSDMKEELDEKLYEMYDIAGIEFNPNSDQQLAELLFGWEKKDSVNKSGKKMKANPNWHIIDLSFDFEPISFTKTGTPQTTGKVLRHLANKYRNTKDKYKQTGLQLLEVLIVYAKLEKLYSAFVEGMYDHVYDDGKIHASCNIIGTVTGRISMSEPNLQQLPKADEDDPLQGRYPIRSLFIGSMLNGKRKKIIALDYSNLEMRILCHYSMDSNLLDMFEHNRDSHGSTAVNMFGLDCDADECKKLHPVERQVGKVLNFMLVYGGGAQALYELLQDFGVDLGSPEMLKKYKCKNGKQVAQVFIDMYFESYGGVSHFMKSQKKYAHRYGYVNTILGRKRRLPTILSGGNSWKDREAIAYEERSSLNSPIQGTAGDITRSAENRITYDTKYLVDKNTSGAQRLRELDCDLIIQVHDELVFEVPEENAEEAISIIKHYMSHPFGDSEDKQLNIFLKVDCEGAADNYHEAK